MQLRLSVIKIFISKSEIKKIVLQRLSLTRALQGFLFPTAKCVFGGCHSSVSMTIQERALNENKLAVTL